MRTRQDGYHVCAGEEELDEWERVSISEKLTGFSRMSTGTPAAHLAHVPKSRGRTWLNTQIKAVDAGRERAASPSR